MVCDAVVCQSDGKHLVIYVIVSKHTDVLSTIMSDITALRLLWSQFPSLYACLFDSLSNVHCGSVVE